MESISFIAFTYHCTHSIIAQDKNSKESEEMKMEEHTIFPREEKTEILFRKILADPWACEKLQETFYNYSLDDEETDNSFSPEEFSSALFASYRNRDLSAFLMVICQNTMFDLLRNACLVPYRFDADGQKNPVIMTDEDGNLLPEYAKHVHEKEFQHFREVYRKLGNDKNMYFAQAYRYSHTYGEETMEVEQRILERNYGVLLIRELPDTVKKKETEAEAYAAVWDLMAELEKNLPMAFVFYGQDALVENNERYDEIGIFLPNSHFLKNMERHVAKAEAIIYGQK